MGVLVRLRTRAAARAVQILTVIGEFFSQNRPQCPNFGQGGASGASVSLRLRPAGAKDVAAEHARYTQGNICNLQLQNESGIENKEAENLLTL